MADAGPRWPDALEAITFDFGNTLVPATQEQLRATTARFAEAVCRADAGIEMEGLIAAWNEERDRQFREDVPNGREADMPTRAVRVLARLHGCPPPAAEDSWILEEALAYSTPDEISAVLNAYATAFVETTPVPPAVEPLLGRLAARYRLAIVSNWPLTAAIERFAEAAGWRAHLSAIVVSQDIGCIKPQPAIFQAAADALGLRSGPSLLHVGDDLGADVGGAQAVGWRAAWIARRPADTPVPIAAVTRPIEPDLVLGSVLGLEAALSGDLPVTATT